MSLIILDEDELVLRVKDSDGNLLQFHGYCRTQTIGDLMDIQAEDIAKEFGRWPVTRDIRNYPLGKLVAAIVGNPTGLASTGVTCHCEEIPDGNNILVVGTFRGSNRSVLDWLNEFARATGFRWYVEWDATTGYHFYWFSSETAPLWTVTLRDNTDRADDSSTSWRVKDGIKVLRDRSNYLNRLRFRANYDPPSPPYGYDDWDAYFTESTTGWAVKTCHGLTPAFTLATDAVTKQVGSTSLKVSWTGTVPAFERDIAPGVDASLFRGILYFKLPRAYQNMYVANFGTFKFRILQKFSIGGVEQTAANNPGLGSGITDYLVDGVQATYSAINQGMFYWILDERDVTDDERAICIVSGQYGSTYDRLHPDDPIVTRGLGQYQHGPWGAWNDGAVGNIKSYHSGAFEATKLQNVWGIGFGVGSAVGQNASTWCKAGDTVSVEQWFDDLRIVPASYSSTDEGPAGTDFVIETAAVTAGTDRPVEGTLDTTGMGYSESIALATKKLAKWSVTQETVSSLEKDGIRTIPMKVRVPLSLPRHGVRTASKALVEVTWKLLDAGDVTTIIVGDVPYDEKRSLESVRRYLDSLAKEKAVTQ